MLTDRNGTFKLTTNVKGILKFQKGFEMKNLMRRIFLGEEDEWFWFYIFTKSGYKHIILYLMFLVPTSYYGWYYDSIVLLLMSKIWLILGAIYGVVWMFLLVTQADQWLW